jgi:hypothetical protein
MDKPENEAPRKIGVSWWKERENAVSAPENIIIFLVAVLAALWILALRMDRPATVFDWFLAMMRGVGVVLIFYGLLFVCWIFACLAFRVGAKIIRRIDDWSRRP